MSDKKTKPTTTVELTEAELDLAAIGLLILIDDVPMVHAQAQVLYKKLIEASVDAMMEAPRK